MTEKENKHSTILTIREYENSVAMPEEERVTYLDPRGGVHLKAGFADVPMLYTQRHMLDAIRPKSEYNPHRHGLSVEQMKRLPELLADPVMLCDSPAREDTMLSLICDVDCDNLPLIAAIKPYGRGYYELHEIETNFILAVYGRTNFPRYFDNLITPDRVIYYNEEKGRELNALAKLRLLRSHIVEPDLLNTIIRRPSCLVKGEAAGQDAYGLASEVKAARAASSRLESRDMRSDVEQSKEGR